MTRITAFGPGRVNLIGEHTDYNGGLALPFAIDRGVTVTADADRRRPDRGDRLDLDEARRASRSRDPPRAADGWRAFVRGIVAELTAAGHAARARRAWRSPATLPQGSGLSSSAALEVALALALLGLAGEPEPDRRALARLCSRSRTTGSAPRPACSTRLASLLGDGRQRAADRLRARWRSRPVPLELGDWRLVTVDSGADALPRRLAATTSAARSATRPRGGSASTTSARRRTSRPRRSRRPLRRRAAPRPERERARRRDGRRAARRRPRGGRAAARRLARQPARRLRRLHPEVERTVARAARTRVPPARGWSAAASAAHVLALLPPETRLPEAPTRSRPRRAQAGRGVARQPPSAPTSRLAPRACALPPVAACPAAAAAPRR